MTGVQTCALPILPSVLWDLLALMASRNAVLCLFNLIPIPPLDGFGVLEPLVPGLRQSSQVLQQYGFLILMLTVYSLHLVDWLWLQSDRLVGLTFRWLSF